jgi:hypothetical protein
MEKEDEEFWINIPSINIRFGHPELDKLWDDLKAKERVIKRIRIIKEILDDDI